MSWPRGLARSWSLSLWPGAPLQTWQSMSLLKQHGLSSPLCIPPGLCRPCRVAQCCVCCWVKGPPVSCIPRPTLCSQGPTIYISLRATSTQGVCMASPAAPCSLQPQLTQQVPARCFLLHRALSQAWLWPQQPRPQPHGKVQGLVLQDRAALTHPAPAVPGLTYTPWAAPIISPR